MGGGASINKQDNSRYMLGCCGGRDPVVAPGRRHMGRAEFEVTVCCCLLITYSGSHIACSLALLVRALTRPWPQAKIGQIGFKTVDANVSVQSAAEVRDWTDCPAAGLWQNIHRRMVKSV